VVFFFFSGVGVKVFCVVMGFVEGVVRVHGEGIEKFLEIAFSRQNIYTSQMEFIVVERAQQRPSDRLVQG